MYRIWEVRIEEWLDTIIFVLLLKLKNSGFNDLSLFPDSELCLTIFFTFNCLQIQTSTFKVKSQSFLSMEIDQINAHSELLNLWFIFKLFRLQNCYRLFKLCVLLELLTECTNGRCSAVLQTMSRVRLNSWLENKNNTVTRKQSGGLNCQTMKKSAV